MEKVVRTDGGTGAESGKINGLKDTYQRMPEGRWLVKWGISGT